MSTEIHPPNHLMVRLNTKCLAVVALSLVAGLAQAQDFGGTPSPNGTLSLRGAIDEGLVHSPDAQRARAAEREAAWARFGALGGGFLPKLQINAHHYLNKEYTYTGLTLGGATLAFPGFYPTDTAALDLSIPIFDGLNNVDNLRAANLVENASTKEREHVEFQLRQSIRLAYFKALAAAQLREVAVQNVKTLDDHLKQTNVQRRGGAATNYDSLRVEVLLNEAKADAIDAEDNVVISRKKLAELMGLEADERPLVDTLPTPDATRVKALELASAKVDRADIQAANLRAEAADRSNSAAKSWMWPTLALNGEYMYYQQQFMDSEVRDTGVWQPAYSLGLFLTWNIFDGGVAIARQKEASEREIQAEKIAQAARIQVPYDFAYWKRRYMSNTDHYLSKKFDTTRSEESVRLAKEEQKAGTRTSTETLDAELDLFRSRAGVVNAQVNAVEAQINLELALGREI